MTDNRVPMTDKELKYAKLEYFSTHYDSIIERLEKAGFWEYLFLTWNIRRMLKWAFPKYLYNERVDLAVEFEAFRELDAYTGKVTNTKVSIDCTVHGRSKSDLSFFGSVPYDYDVRTMEICGLGCASTPISELI